MFNGKKQNGEKHEAYITLTLQIFFNGRLKLDIILQWEKPLKLTFVNFMFSPQMLAWHLILLVYGEN